MKKLLSYLLDNILLIICVICVGASLVIGTKFLNEPILPPSVIIIVIPDIENESQRERLNIDPRISTTSIE